MERTTYRTLDGLAAALNLPRTYLKRLSDAGQIPFLEGAGGRRHFDEGAVVDALRKLAAEGRT